MKPQEKKYCVGLLFTLAVCIAALGQSPIPPSGDTSLRIIIQDKNIDSLDKLDLPPPPDSLFIIRQIYITGNRKTRADIMLREIPFKPGDQYPLPELVKNFEKARKQLMNTTLFHEVVVSLKSFDGYQVDIQVQVRERWYLLPVPYFKPVDRNLNQWLVEQKASLSRVNYGAKLMYNNVTGRNDKLRLYAITGYTKQFSFSYDRLYIDKAMKWGMNVSMAMGKNREINHITIDNKQEFLKSEDYLRNFFSGNLELTYRRAIKTRHRIGIGYTSERVADSVLYYNPSFLKDSRTQVKFPEVYYAMSYFDVDYIPYPTKGYAADLVIGKKGFNNAMNMWHLSAKGLGSWHTGRSSFFSVAVGGTLRVPFRQPYYNKRFLGYGDLFLQGYEYYVVDGVAGGYTKATFGKRLINFTMRIPGFKRIAPRSIPVNIYGKVYGNAGYVYNPEPGENTLSNRMLFSGGFGLDIFTIYDFTLKLEWSFNQLGENGLYLHRKSIF